MKPRFPILVADSEDKWVYCMDETRLKALIAKDQVAIFNISKRVEDVSFVYYFNFPHIHY